MSGFRDYAYLNAYWKDIFILCFLIDTYDKIVTCHWKHLGPVVLDVYRETPPSPLVVKKKKDIFIFTKFLKRQIVLISFSDFDKQCVAQLRFSHKSKFKKYIYITLHFLYQFRFVIMRHIWWCLYYLQIQKRNISHILKSNYQF